MLQNASPLFTGCSAALVTPFAPNGSVDIPALRRLLDMQIDAGMDAVILLGTTGEPTALAMQEREVIIQTAVRECAGHMPVIVGTGANSTARAIEYARQALALGADGQLCVTPYYNKATQTGLIRHYCTILEAAPLPMILYNVPGRTGLSMSVDTAVKLSTHPLVVGLKEAGGGIPFACEIMRRTGSRLPIYCGNDDSILPLMACGAVGAISVVANLLPKKTRALTSTCLAGDFSQARNIQLTLLPLIDALFAQVSPIPVKAALAMRSICGETLRMPLTPLEEPYRTQLQNIIKALKD